MLKMTRYILVNIWNNLYVIYFSVITTGIEYIARSNVSNFEHFIMKK